MPPVQPMLAKSVKGIPDPAKYDGLIFEPKWDGFRCIVFRDGDEVELTSRNTKPLTRYFPDLVEAIKRQLPERIVLDGEVFVARSGTGSSSRCSRSASTRLSHGSTCWPRRRRPASSPSTCSPWATSRTPSGRCASGGPRWRRRWAVSAPRARAT